MKNQQDPQVIHLGKRSKKEVGHYHQGIGAMHLEVQHLVAQARGKLEAGHEVLPLVVIHRKKRKTKLQSLQSLFS